MRQPAKQPFTEHVMKRTSRTIGRSVRSLSNAISCELLERRRLMATVAGSCWYDIANNNAVDAGDSLAGGMTVYVDLNNDGALTAGEPSFLTQGGGFSISGVPTGTYNVRATGLPGLNLFSTNVPSAALPGTDSVASVNLFNVSTVYPLTSSSSTDAYTLRRNVGGTKFELARSGGTTYTLPLNVPSLQINGGALNDSLTVDYVNGNPIPAGGVNFDGGTHTDAVIVNGSSAADTFALNDGTVSNGGTITYANTESLALNLQAGNDTVNVIITKLPTTISGGNDDDTFNVGPGTLDNIQAPMTINGEGGPDRVTLDDSLTPYPDTYTITSTTVVRPAFGGLTYGTIERLDLLGEFADNVYNIESTASGVNTAVVDQIGSDTFNLAPTGQDLANIH